MGRARALEILLSRGLRRGSSRNGTAGSIELAGTRCRPFRQVARPSHREFPGAGHVTVKQRVNAITLAPAEDFRRDSDLFVEGLSKPDAQARLQTAMKVAFRRGRQNWTWLGFLADLPEN
jgi:hypothetical protein